MRPHYNNRSRAQPEMQAKLQRYEAEMTCKA